jgi:hypothetical protein
MLKKFGNPPLLFTADGKQVCICVMLVCKQMYACFQSAVNCNTNANT